MTASAAMELPVSIDDSLKVESVQVISGLAFDNLKVLLTWLANQVKDQVRASPIPFVMNEFDGLNFCSSSETKAISATDTVRSI